ncbi:LADA_0E06986g1_1 [Lachancea dasiensis]|uniref:sphinganine-1-phosphate aldolase n=1 Tax=Lachancea dasiensis TaxID=1072105 RepID=A0A1G4JCQ8_9SACH|nr:LADA_0E06986g1_1 [Lachancea dasiensis]
MILYGICDWFGSIDYNDLANICNRCWHELQGNREHWAVIALTSIVLYKILAWVWYYVGGFGWLECFRMVRNQTLGPMFRTLSSSFLLRDKVDKEVEKSLASLEKSLMKDDDRLTQFAELPADGWSDQDVLNELDLSQNVLAHSDWEGGKVSGAVYHGGQDLIRLQSQAFEKYCVANQLHPDVFPAVRKMESEVVSMVMKMFNAPESDGACGTTTSGGTESLLLACLSAKMYGLRKKGIRKPEIIAPTTAHAAFDKAAYYFGITLRHAPLDAKTLKVDLTRVRRLINKNTILLVGSAPNFPHGIIDDIEGLGMLAQKYSIPLHVDCCLGSFVIAHMEKAGFKDLPPFDFRVPQVTSISCDTHKYGFAPKGSSIILYRNRELRMHQYFLSSDWVGGLYGSPTLAGSRPGALVVGCWATMVRMGERGYVDSCREIVHTARRLKNFIHDNIPELQILGDPLCSVVSFTSDKINVHELSDRLAQQGWHFSALQNPPALHLAVTWLTRPVMSELTQTLQSLVKELSANSDQKPSSNGTSALYGVAGSVQTKGVVDRLLVGFLDTLYKTKHEF